MGQPFSLHHRKALFVCLLATVLLLLFGCSDEKQTNIPQPIPFEGGKIVGRLPRDAQSFTQGLELVSENEMAESSGLWGESAITLYDSRTGKARSTRQLPDDEFGEGLTRVNNTLIQLTWKKGIAHTYTLPELTPGPDFYYNGEGWGLCYDQSGNLLWRSDGSDTLTAHDPATFEVIKTLRVHEKGQPVAHINELEMVGGHIYANLWFSDDIIALDPTTGEVTRRYPLTPLVTLAEEDNGKPFTKEQVLNGIAYDADNSRFYLTGKQWPYTYIVELDTP